MRKEIRLLNNVRELVEIKEFLRKKTIEDYLSKGFLIPKDADKNDLIWKDSEFFPIYSKINNVLYDLGYDLREYSSFRTGITEEVISVLLTYVEGERFVPYMYFRNGLYTHEIVVKESLNNGNSIKDNDELDRLCDKGDIVILNEGMGSHILFYDIEGESYYNLSKYDYLKDFIHELIQYRIDNSIKNKDISESQEYEVLYNYLKKHPELRKKNKKKREALLNETEKNVETSHVLSKIKKSVKKNVKDNLII